MAKRITIAQISICIIICCLFPFAEPAKCKLQKGSGPGPVYVPNAPLVAENVCEKLPPHRYYKVDGDYCTPACTKRIDAGPAYKLRLQGTVMNEDCEGIEGALIEVWHTDGQGIYNFFISSDNVGCFGSIKSKADGKYNLITWKPGNYGILSGIFSFMDIPPFLPQHIHIAVSAPGYKLFTTQLGFSDDLAREWDLRDVALHAGINMTHPDLVLTEINTTETIDGITVKLAKHDFVLEKDPNNTPVEEQWKKFCDKPPYPPALCYPTVYKVVFSYGVYGALLIILGNIAIIGFLLLKFFCGFYVKTSKTPAVRVQSNPAEQKLRKKKAE